METTYTIVCNDEDVPRIQDLNLLIRAHLGNVMSQTDRIEMIDTRFFRDIGFKLSGYAAFIHAARIPHISFMAMIKFANKIDWKFPENVMIQGKTDGENKWFLISRSSTKKGFEVTW